MSKSKIGVPLEGFAEYCRVAAAEGMVLLKNENEMLPIKKDEVLSVFGRCQVDYYRSGTGSGGAVNVEYAVNALEGLRNNSVIKVNETLAKVYENWIEENPFDNGGGAWAAEPWFQKEMTLTDEVVMEARKTSEKAIYIIGRTAGEDQDNAYAEGSYCLTAEEKQALAMITKYFDNVAVIVNVSNIIDMSWVNDSAYGNSIKAILYSWHGGIEGGNALADVLSGNVTPSGKLADTIAYDINDYPSTANFGSKVRNIYQEDIYVGYRYFETFNPEAVQYAFGYGLSYTTFSMETTKATVVGQGEHAEIVIDVKVTNTGDEYAGKEIVQVYYGAPQGKLGKPVKELGAFAKTNVLNPGESQVLTITLPVSRMSSYDDGGYTGNKSCYVLESGDYNIYVGSNVKNVDRVSVDGQDAFKVEELIVVEQLKEVMAPIMDFTRMKPGVQKEDGTYEVVYDEAPKRTVSMEGRVIDNLPTTYEQTGDRGIKLRDVKEGKATLEEFIAQLSNAELAAIVRGEGMCSPKVTPGTAAAFGGITDGLLAYGIPTACCADGPSGIRMDSGHKATQVPIGTLLACSWNIDMMKELYELEGKELVQNNIDSLLGPGVNIHRNPLNGRNFEYFSEDPYVTGCFAAAVTSSIKKSGSTATVKHYAGNDQETARVDVDSVVSERALREIHLKPFEMAVKEGDAVSIMTSYNPINGHWAASNYDLNTTVLRGEWGYTGIVMTDWWAKMNNPISAGIESKQATSFMVRAQNDLYMVIENHGADSNVNNDDTEVALANGTLTVGELQRSAMNICRFVMNALVFDREVIDYSATKKFEANEVSNNETVYTISEKVEINTKTNCTVTLKVEEAGVYEIVGNLRYEKNSLAQSACCIMLNNEFAGSAPVNGTDGAWLSQNICPVELEVGFYDLKLDFIKPGMEVGVLEFIKK